VIIVAGLTGDDPKAGESPKHGEWWTQLYLFTVCIIYICICICVFTCLTVKYVWDDLQWLILDGMKPPIRDWMVILQRPRFELWGTRSWPSAQGFEALQRRRSDSCCEF
jgi:hypothetical protein